MGNAEYMGTVGLRRPQRKEVVNFSSSQ